MKLFLTAIFSLLVFSSGVYVGGQFFGINSDASLVAQFSSKESKVANDATTLSAESLDSVSVLALTEKKDVFVNVDIVPQAIDENQNKKFFWDEYVNKNTSKNAIPSEENDLVVVENESKSEEVFDEGMSDEELLQLHHDLESGFVFADDLRHDVLHTDSEPDLAIDPEAEDF